MAHAAKDAAAIEAAFDPASFTRNFQLLALRVPLRSIPELLQPLRKGKFVFTRPGFPPVQLETTLPVSQPDEQKTLTKLIVLKQEIDKEDLSQLPEDIRALVRKLGVQICGHALSITYKELSYEEVLRVALPEGVNVPTGFETAGSIAHFNLFEQQLPFKRLIGRVFIDKHKAIRTVVNKTGTIENEFRVMPMEIIGGVGLNGDAKVNPFITEVRQAGLSFQIDYSKVYWNSRLEQEHKRLVAEFRRGDVVCDMFCGVGPFAVPAAVAGCIVHANDLNPHSYEYLVINARKNKVTSCLHAYNMDARAFIREMAGRVQCSCSAACCASLSVVPGGGEGKQGANAAIRSLPIPAIHHIVMNLPASAIQFCDAFRGLFAHFADRHREALCICRLASASDMTHASAASLSASSSSSSSSLSLSSSSAPSLPSSPKRHCSNERNDPQELIKEIEIDTGKEKEEKKERRKGRSKDEQRDSQSTDTVAEAVIAHAPGCVHMPRVHCYCFSKADDTEADVRMRTEVVLGARLPTSTKVHHVRIVSPGNEMLCVSFDLPRAVAFAHAPTPASASSSSVCSGNSSHVAAAATVATPAEAAAAVPMCPAKRRLDSAQPEQ